MDGGAHLLEARFGSHFQDVLQSPHAHLAVFGLRGFRLGKYDAVDGSGWLNDGGSHVGRVLGMVGAGGGRLLGLVLFAFVLVGHGWCR